MIDSFFFCWGSVLQIWKLIAHRFTNNPCYMGQSDISLRPPTAVAATTAYLYDAELFVSRGVVLILNITSAEMCASYTDREKEAREGLREAAKTKREGSYDRNHRFAFFNGFKHPLHQPLPDFSFTPCRLSLRHKETFVHAFTSPFHVRSERMRLGMRFYPMRFSTFLKAFASFPVLLWYRVLFYGFHSWKFLN